MTFIMKISLLWFRRAWQFDPVTGLRGIACLAVIWSHSFPPWNTWYFGNIAVFIFYLISGYAVGYGYFSKKYSINSPREIGKFYLNRFLRIAPTYYVCLLLSFFIFYTHVPMLRDYYLRFFTFTANFRYYNVPELGMLVIISTEMQFYLVAPLLFFVMSFMVRKFHPVAVALTILILGVIVRYGMYMYGFANDLKSYYENIYVTVWGSLDLFLFGMFVSYLVTKGYIIRITRFQNILMLGFIGVFIGWVVWIHNIILQALLWKQVIVNQTVIIPASLCVLVGWLILTTRRTDFRHITRPKAILFHLTDPRTTFFSLGTISYGMYVYQDMGLGFVYRWLPNAGEFTTLMFFGTLFTLCLALLSYTLIEYPVLLLRYRLKRNS